MAIARQRLLKDKPMIGEGPAMCSASQRAFKLNDVVYTYSVNLRDADNWGEDEDEDEEDDPKGVKITAHRVIQINYQDRLVRLRCGNGCEMTLNYGESGCSKERAFHDLDQVKRLAAKAIKDQVKHEKKKRAEYDLAIKNLENCDKRLRTLKVQAPHSNV